MKDIKTKNNNGNAHGYQEWYFIDFWFRGCYKNGEPIGYQENHGINTYGAETNFYVK